jgi:hypothetical protein
VGGAAEDVFKIGSYRLRAYDGSERGPQLCDGAARDGCEWICQVPFWLWKVQRHLAVRWWFVAARVVIASVAGVSLAVLCSASTIAHNALRALCAPDPHEAHILLVSVFPGISNLCRLALVGFLVCLIALSTRHRRWFAAVRGDCVGSNRARRPNP